MTTAEGFVLPTVNITPGRRFAEAITEAIRNSWKLNSVCLSNNPTFLAKNCNGVCYQAVEAIREIMPDKSSGYWTEIAALTRDSFRDGEDYAAIVRILNELSSADELQPFTRRRWFAELQSWVESTIRPFGLHLAGDFRQISGSPSFSLIRLETNGRALWFKAVGEPNLREFRIAVELSNLFPDYVPSVLSTLPRWNGWLTWEVEGMSLENAESSRDWQIAAAALARLQIASLGHSQDLIQFGSRDLTVRSLSHLVAPLFDAITEVMAQQPRVPPPVLTKTELLQLKQGILEILGCFAGLEIPETLGHLDLNPGNVFLSQSECVFLDWAEAYVGCPFWSFAYLLQHYRRSGYADAAGENAMSDAYWQIWASLIPQQDLACAQASLSVMAVFVYACQIDHWKRPPESSDQRQDAYLRSLARRMKNELDQLGTHKCREAVAAH